ncbi:MAG: hypothetical protein EZS28_044338, partial [Streblomastix strix]
MLPVTGGILRAIGGLLRLASNISFVSSKSIEVKIEPGLKTINWNSMSIDAYIQTVGTSLDQFEALLIKGNDTIRYRIATSLWAMEHTELVALPVEQCSIPEYVAGIEDFTKVQGETMQVRNKETETAVVDMIRLILSSMAPAKQISMRDQAKRIYRHFERESFQMLLRTVITSLNTLKTWSEGNVAAIFELTIELEKDKPVLKPSLREIRRSLVNVSKMIISTTKRTYRWTDFEDIIFTSPNGSSVSSSAPSSRDPQLLTSGGRSPSRVSISAQSLISDTASQSAGKKASREIDDPKIFFDLINQGKAPSTLLHVKKESGSAQPGLPTIDEEKESGTEPLFDRIAAHNDVLRCVLLLANSLRQFRHGVKEYVARFNEFKDLWEGDMEQEIAAFVATTPKLEQYQDQVRKYDDIATKVNLIPSQHEVSMFMINSQPIKDTFLELINEWKAHYAQTLH